MERERITISVKKKVLDLVDQAIDGTNVRNRSHAIETLIMKAVGNSIVNSAAVLLGGDNAIKALPATKDFLSKLDDFQFEKINIAVGFLGDKIRQKLGAESENGIMLEYTDKGEGSGGALLHLKKYLAGNTFFVLNTTKIYDLDLKFLINYHLEHKAIATIITDDLQNMTGLYLFNSDIFQYIPKGFSMLEDEVLPTLLREGKAIVYPATATN